MVKMYRSIDQKLGLLYCFSGMYNFLVDLSLYINYCSLISSFCKMVYIIAEHVELNLFHGADKCIARMAFTDRHLEHNVPQCHKDIRQLVAKFSRLNLKIKRWKSHDF